MSTADTDFNWKGAITRYGDELYNLVITLVSLVSPAFQSKLLPRHMRITILRSLRPAEFAARRLFAMAARVFEFDLPPARERPSKKLEGRIEPARDKLRPTFKLFDPKKHYGPFFLSEEEVAARNDPNRILPPRPVLPPDELVDVTSLCRRANALWFALEDVQHQAYRLARWRARRHLKTCRPKTCSPIRVGIPPGWKEKPKTEIECLLKDLHHMGREVWAWPDTS